MGASLEELHQRNQNAERARLIEAQIRLAAAEQGIPVGQARANAMKPPEQTPPPSGAEATTQPPTTKPSTALVPYSPHTTPMPDHDAPAPAPSPITAHNTELADIPWTSPVPGSHTTTGHVPGYHPMANVPWTSPVPVHHPAPPRPPPRWWVDPDHGERMDKLETKKALEEHGKALQVVERKQKNKKEFVEANIAPPGSIAEAILEVAGMGGAHVGRGVGTLTGLHLSERANADPATTAALTTGGGAIGSVAGKRAAKKVTEHAIRGAHKVYEQGPAARKEGFQRPQIQEADRFMGWGAAWVDGWVDGGEF